MTPGPTLDPVVYRDIVRRALAEDIGAGDVTTAATVDPALRARGEIVAKCECVIAGLAVAEEVFRQVDGAASMMVHKGDGSRCVPGDIVAEIHGSSAGLLTAERTALNLLQRMTGIATITRRFVEAAGGRITILDTRKTTPMLRMLEKYAVATGGGTNHRIGLYDAILIKDNHIRLAGGVREAVARSRAAQPSMTVEVEAQSLEQVDEAIASGADIILLDNLSTQDIREAVRRIGGRARTELSGGVTLDRIPELAATGADFVSVGALTHSAPASDLSLEIHPA